MAKNNFKGKGIIIIGILVVVLLIVVMASIILKKEMADTPIDLTKKYMNKYKTVSSEVMNKVKYPYDDDLTNSQLQKYIELIKSQYMALDYEIVSENVGEIDAIIKVEFTVLDYASSYERATSYISLYGTDMSVVQANNYKLNEMEKTTDKITYAIELTFYKMDGKWQMSDLSKTDISKLSGMF